MNVLQGINPVTRIVALIAFTTPLLLSVDWVSATVALVLILIFSPLCGLRWSQLIRRSIPILMVTPVAGASMALYGRSEGREYFSFAFAHVTDNSLALALAIMLRILAVALPVIVLTRGIDPTEMGDGLAQVAKFPERFVIGSVAGVRLMTLFQRDWAALARARRARGVADEGRIRSALGMAFSLLVLAIRRGTKLATAMEARGFGGDRPRTWARPSTVTWRDGVVVLVAIACGVLAIAIAVWAGEFRFLGA
ncbi:Energy-coupling factor transporter transmembrane protein EcfT [Corynebacterium kalinowskii]|uniref:Energy-coupling factor transporter transmembrane protein EcfT n=1 Tax=Corynebacterium kalinowskii TaxID=2675216 RepID=A0A6B8VYM2_9CORY|nr:energy-coupling factor transporter transmembrane component T [Corynebacterium kalinowskii]QGU02420.1 Energy-coupling factor transporter transmembrane protein EcfT [Corynebacterium kalinowskii]